MFKIIRFLLIILFSILVMLSIVILGGYFINRQSYPSLSNLPKSIKYQLMSMFIKCPDQKIYNGELIVGKLQNRQNTIKEYFVVDGNRKELEDYDLNWVKEKCNPESINSF